LLLVRQDLRLNLHGRRKLRKHASVDLVGLRQVALALGGVVNLPRVHHRVCRTTVRSLWAEWS